jgi:hypothetical protein
VPRMQHEVLPGSRRAALNRLVMLVPGLCGLPAAAGADTCTRKECQVRAEQSQDLCPESSAPASAPACVAQINTKPLPKG